MKIIRKNYLILIIGLTILILYLTLIIYNNKLDQTTKYTESGETNYENDWLRSNFYFNNKYEGVYFYDSICESFENTNIHLSELVKERAILIFNYSYLNCNTCYEEEISIFNEVFKNNIDEALILCKYEIKRDYLVFRKFNKSEIPIYRILSRSNFADEIDAPFYFLLHNDLRMTHLFIPEKQYPEKSKQYLEKMKRLLNTEA